MESHVIFTPDIGADEFDLSERNELANAKFKFSGKCYGCRFFCCQQSGMLGCRSKISANTTPYAGYIRTTDGGDNWICDTIPGISNGYFQQIFAIDADTAYVHCLCQSGTQVKRCL